MSSCSHAFLWLNWLDEIALLEESHISLNYSDNCSSYIASLLARGLTVDIVLFSLAYLCFSHEFSDSGIPFYRRRQTGPPCIRSACLLQHQKYKRLVWDTLARWGSRRPTNMISNNPEDSNCSRTKILTLLISQKIVYFKYFLPSRGSLKGRIPL